MESIPDLGQVTVYDWVHDYDRGCTGRGWGFRLPDVANDIPMFKISAQLQGKDVMTSVQVVGL